MACYPGEQKTSRQAGSFLVRRVGFAFTSHSDQSSKCGLRSRPHGASCWTHIAPAVLIPRKPNRWLATRANKKLPDKLEVFWCAGWDSPSPHIPTSRRNVGSGPGLTVRPAGRTSLRPFSSHASQIDGLLPGRTKNFQTSWKFFGAPGGIRLHLTFRPVVEMWAQVQASRCVLLDAHRSGRSHPTQAK